MLISVVGRLAVVGVDGDPAFLRDESMHPHSRQFLSCCSALSLSLSHETSVYDAEHG